MGLEQSKSNSDNKSQQRLFWKSKFEFVSPYSLDECVNRLQNLDVNRKPGALPITIREVPEKSGVVDFTLSTSGPRLTSWLIGRLEYRNEQETTVSGYTGVHWLTVLLVIVLPPVFTLAVGLVALPVELLKVIAAIIIYAVVLSVYFVYANVLKGELIDQLRSKLTK